MLWEARRRGARPQPALGEAGVPGDGATGVLRPSIAGPPCDRLRSALQGTGQQDAPPLRDGRHRRARGAVGGIAEPGLTPREDWLDTP